MKLSLASIHIHPIKSLGGFSIEEGRITDRGLEGDRRWIMVDETGVFLSQREAPEMACLHTSPSYGGFTVSDLRNGRSISIPWQIDQGEKVRVSVWSDKVNALHQGDLDQWFSEALDRNVRLVFMPVQSKRRTDGRYAKSLNSFSDGFPYLIVSQASLDDLNEKLARSGSSGAMQIPMDRFRPNFVIAGGEAFQEDQWRSISIGEIGFELVKPCARCVIVTTDQQTGKREKEPLRTLSTYRSKGNKVLFAMNAVAHGEGTIRRGDPIEVQHLR
ncbi:MAG: MOSC domain-containing protein [Bacteroidota bacterium]|nr:MOSC domain-containing protein [Bacteroidota bacterium]